MKSRLSLTLFACLVASALPAAAQEQTIRLPIEDGLRLDPRGVERGDTVFVTDETGRTVEGTLTQLSVSSIAVNVPTPDARAFDAASIRKITAARSLWADLKSGAKLGMVLGGGSGAVVGFVTCIDDCLVPAPLAALVFGAFASAIALPIGLTNGAVLHAFRNEHASRKQAAYQGALIGLAGGFAGGLTTGAGFFHGEPTTVKVFAAWGAGAGALAGALIGPKRGRTLYQAPGLTPSRTFTMSPFVGPGRKGLAATFRY
jgi:hypothetical protein